jgi:hypothetical protein
VTQRDERVERLARARDERARGVHRRRLGNDANDGFRSEGRMCTQLSSHDSRSPILCIDLCTVERRP